MTDKWRDLSAEYQELCAADKAANYERSVELQNRWDAYSAAIHGYESVEAWKNRPWYRY